MTAPAQTPAAEPKTILAELREIVRTTQRLHANRSTLLTADLEQLGHGIARAEVLQEQAARAGLKRIEALAGEVLTDALTFRILLATGLE